ncbi:long-chain acyl-CoA synthetase [Nocardia amikacinitolerans]|uniref:long-chain-fatty-acid--CoA ligase n=1 Tax=Nocardia amikacinitolerans TaxID=756689 RepID=UPI0008296753|nr:long-chain fatty acid--CoA ligase [Nocardia amikacinitolerans]MCP2315113.1 long-chain acyl-CoA synthetase [Nocardia amikacinitolerans]
MSFNLATILRESRDAAPHAPCLISRDRRLSYAEVDEESSRFARGLRANGLGAGDVLAVSLPNSAEFVIAYFGALKAGAIFMPLNPMLKAREVTHCLADSGARTILAHHDSVDEIRHATRSVDGANLFVVDAGAPIPFGARHYSDLLIADADEIEQPSDDIAHTAATDTAVLLYTSGTTGSPKGVPLNHFQLYMNCTVSAEAVGVRGDDVALAALPMFHVFGLSAMLNVAIRAGASLSVMERFDADAALAAMERDGVSIVLGVPTMYFALLAADASGRDLRRLRIACSGGASLPAEILTEFEKRFGVTVVEGYGLSETASSATANKPGDRRFGSVGKPIWGVRLRIVDDRDRPLPAGPDHIGEILLAGHNVIDGYYRQPAATRAAFSDGWFRTGDLGYRDADGFVFIVDRKKDLVIRGGYNVYPREVEEVLYTHPAIAEAAVVGVPDERLGEEVHAVVALKIGGKAEPQEIIDFCKQRLAAYKYPRAVRIVDELPKGPSGKILKRELRSL